MSASVGGAFRPLATRDIEKSRGSVRMAQFIVRVYPGPRGLRVVVDGMTHFDTVDPGTVEPLAVAAILSRLRAFLPPRAAPPSDPAATATLFFEIELRRVGAPGGESGPRNPGDQGSRPA